MKTEIKIAVSYKQITHEIKEVDLPEVSRYYQKGDLKEGFLSDIELFAIILRGSPTSGWYIIARIKRDSQEVNDFIPRKDVTSEFWVDGNGLRKKAMDIIIESQSPYKPFQEIEYNEFIRVRQLLLDDFMKDI